jgi:hypothetical protein
LADTSPLCMEFRYALTSGAVSLNKAYIAARGDISRG